MGIKSSLAAALFLCAPFAVSLAPAQPHHEGHPGPAPGHPVPAPVRVAPPPRHEPPPFQA